jgi:CubicO group peptidase (beta-lactamase class C family)
MKAIAPFAALMLTTACTPLALQPLQQAEAAVMRNVLERRLPGAVLLVEREGSQHLQAFGRFTYDPDAAAVQGSSVFDAASLTKVVATAPAVLLLAEEGKLALDAPVSAYLPDCPAGITVRHLLTHTSGLPAGLPATPAWEGQEHSLALACAQKPTHPPGALFRYSDVNYVLLGHLVRSLSGQSLDAFARARLFAPLGMRDTGYLPLAWAEAARIVPTFGPPGVVHDPTARRMGGVGGSAGMFSTAPDLARFARMLLAGGMLEGRRILSAGSVRLLTTAQTPPGIPELRGMGMDIASPFARPRGSIYPVGSYGHTGFTGCILWIDPDSRSFYVFLSNRVHPDDRSNILPLYSTLGTLAAQATRAAQNP